MKDGNWPCKYEQWHKIIGKTLKNGIRFKVKLVTNMTIDGRVRTLQLIANYDNNRPNRVKYE